MKSTKLERSRMRRKVSRTILKSSEEGRPSSLRQQYADETTEEDLRKIAEKAPIIKLAYDELDRFSWNEKDLVAYEERIMDLRKEEAILEYRLDLATEKGIQIGEERGIKIGKEEGKIEGKIEVAKAMLANNVDVNTIVKFTGLSISEIEELSVNGYSKAGFQTGMTPFVVNSLLLDFLVYLVYLFCHSAEQIHSTNGQYIFY